MRITTPYAESPLASRRADLRVMLIGSAAIGFAIGWTVTATT